MKGSERYTDGGVIVDRHGAREFDGTGDIIWRVYEGGERMPVRSERIAESPACSRRVVSMVRL